MWGEGWIFFGEMDLGWCEYVHKDDMRHGYRRTHKKWNCIYCLLTQLVEGIVVYYILKETATVTIETLVMLHVRGGRTTCTLCIKIDTTFWITQPLSASSHLEAIWYQRIRKWLQSLIVECMLLSTGFPAGQLHFLSFNRSNRVFHLTTRFVSRHQVVPSLNTTTSSVDQSRHRLELRERIYAWGGAVIDSSTNPNPNPKTWNMYL